MILTISQNSNNLIQYEIIVKMKALGNILKAGNASDEFKSTFKVCLKWALPDHTRRDPNSADVTTVLACLSLSAECALF